MGCLLLQLIYAFMFLNILACPFGFDLQEGSFSCYV